MQVHELEQFDHTCTVLGKPLPIKRETTGETLTTFTEKLSEIWFRDVDKHWSTRNATLMLESKPITTIREFKYAHDVFIRSKYRFCCFNKKREYTIFYQVFPQFSILIVKNLSRYRVDILIVDPDNISSMITDCTFFPDFWFTVPDKPNECVICHEIDEDIRLSCCCKNYIHIRCLEDWLLHSYRKGNNPCCLTCRKEYKWFDYSSGTVETNIRSYLEYMKYNDCQITKILPGMVWLCNTEKHITITNGSIQSGENRLRAVRMSITY